MNVWTPARTLADPKAILLGLVAGVALGAALIYTAVGPGLGVFTGWKHASSWAWDYRLSRWQRAALKWYETHSDDPVIQLLECKPTRVDPTDGSHGIAILRMRVRAAGGATAEKTEVIRMRASGEGERLHPWYVVNYPIADDAVVISGRPR